MKASLTRIMLPLALACGLGLSACSSDMDDLDRYVNEVKARPGGRIEPLPQDHESGFEFEDDTFGGSVPKQYMPAIEKGIRTALEHGVARGGGLRAV